MPSLYDYGLESRLPHPDGGGMGGIDNPHSTWRLAIEYQDGLWWVIPADQYGNPQRGKRREISREFAVTLHELGLIGIAPDVLDQNRETWLRAFVAWTEEQHRRAVQGREEALLKARNALAKAEARSDA
jgi:hypothetical protein